MIGYYIICIAFLLVVLYMFALLVSLLIDLTIKPIRLEIKNNMTNSWAKFKTWIYFKFLNL